MEGKGYFEVSEDDFKSFKQFGTHYFPPLGDPTASTFVRSPHVVIDLIKRGIIADVKEFEKVTWAGTALEALEREEKKKS